MKKNIQFMFIILIAFMSINQTQAYYLSTSIDSVSFHLPKNEQTMTQRADKILNSKFGHWLVKKAVKKVAKRQAKLDKKNARKQAKKGEHWKPKKQKVDDFTTVLALILVAIGLLFGVGGLFTLPFNQALARDLFYIALSFICAAGGCIAA